MVMPRNPKLYREIIDARIARLTKNIRNSNSSGILESVITIDILNRTSGGWGERFCCVPKTNSHVIKYS